MFRTPKQHAQTTIRGWAKRQIKQPSTWRGLALLATAVGANISPEMLHAAVAIGTTVVGMIDVMTNDDRMGAE